MFPIDPRHGFLPPRYCIYRIDSDASDKWRDVPTLPLLTDPEGEEPARAPARIQLAWDEDALHVRAFVPETAPVLKPELPPDHPDFWTQDNIELRLLPDPERERAQWQFIFAADARCWDSAGLWRTGGMSCRGMPDAEGWRIEARIVWSALGRRSPQSGEVLHGVAAHVRWAEGWADVSACSPVVLALSHAERFAEFVFEEDAETPRLADLTPVEGRMLAGENAFSLTILNPAEKACAGNLIVERQTGPDLAGRRRIQSVTFVPGQSRCEAALRLERPAYARYVVRFESGGHEREMGAVTLRAAVPDLDATGLELEHPYLFWNRRRLAELRRKAGNPAFARWAEQLQAHGSDLDLPEPGAPVLKLASRVNNCLRKWLLSQDERLVRLASECIELMRQDLSLPSHIDLHEGNVSHGLAVAYDTFHPLLTEAERGAWVEVLSGFLEMYLRTARSRHWNCTAIPNANSVCNGGGGLLALALLREHPEAEEALGFARKWIWRYIDYSYGPDGGCTEGMQYWNYGGMAYLRLVYGLECALGTDDGLFAHPHFRGWANNFRLSISNDGKMHGVNDTIPVPIGVDIACFLAGRMGDPLCLWWSTKGAEVREDMLRRGRECPYRAGPALSMLWRPDVPVLEEQPDLPTAILLSDIQYATVRSGAEYDGSLVAGIKGNRPPYTHHRQPDTGACFVHVRGERMLIDPGYYKPEPTDHCLPLIDGAGPAWPESFDGEITRCRAAGDVRLLVCDAARAYMGRARRVRRTLVLLGEEAVVLLDDIAGAGEGAATVTAQYQCGGPTKLSEDKRTVLIEGQRVRLRLELLTQPDLALEAHPERTFHDTHWGYHFAECRWFPVTGSYVVDGCEPLITVFTDVTTGDAAPCRLVRSESELVVRLASGRELRLIPIEDVWRIAI